MTTADSCHEIRDTDGTLPAYAWPGGYPVLYLAADGESFCPGCANNEPEVHFGQEIDDAWSVIGWFIHYEGPPELCCNCGESTSSAYGDPDELEPVLLWEGSAGARALLPDANEEYSGPQRNGGA